MVVLQLAISGTVYVYLKHSCSVQLNVHAASLQSANQLSQEGGSLLSKRHVKLEAQHQELAQKEVECKPCNCPPPKQQVAGGASSIKHEDTKLQLDSMEALLSEGKHLEQQLHEWHSAALALDKHSSSAGAGAGAGASSALGALLLKLPGLSRTSAAGAGSHDGASGSSGSSSGVSSGAGGVKRSAMEAASGKEGKALALSGGSGSEGSGNATAISTAAEFMANGHPYTTVVPPPPQYMMRPADEIAKVRRAAPSAPPRRAAPRHSKPRLVPP